MGLLAVAGLATLSATSTSDIDHPAPVSQQAIVAADTAASSHIQRADLIDDLIDILDGILGGGGDGGGSGGGEP